MADDERIVYRGRPDAVPPYRGVPLHRTSNAIVFLEWSRGPRNPLGDLETWPNLVRVDARGIVGWRAMPNGTPDRWVGGTSSPTALWGYTASGSEHQPDPDTGRRTLAQ